MARSIGMVKKVKEGASTMEILHEVEVLVQSQRFAIPTILHLRPSSRRRSWRSLVASCSMMTYCCSKYYNDYLPRRWAVLSVFACNAPPSRKQSKSPQTTSRSLYKALVYLPIIQSQQTQHVDFIIFKWAGMCRHIFFGTYRYLDIILWNPLTGNYKSLSKVNSHASCFMIPRRGYGLYYSSCDNDYKLLRITESSSAYIYSLKSDSWRKVESTSCRFLKYWNNSSKTKINVWSYSIIRFDTNTEKFTEIAAPSLPYVAKCCFSLTVVTGCVHLCASSKGVNLWDKLDM
ncbi:hypothetical protein OSB04_028511 [Centaurea solstitialis]|uniref:F-box associated beta-propeller type 1 domain-containing protein n=1 Tax=Centaurea solstitialis TaxID=347529 RepID=A0AA38STB6_9ASTR|nr:hypothetical protein OSB04_028511 [Centaurea solstitialis]